MTCCHSCDRVLFCPDCDKDYHLKLIDINKLKEAIKQHSTSEFDDDIIELTTLYELIDNHTVDEPVPKSECKSCENCYGMNPEILNVTGKVWCDKWGIFPTMTCDDYDPIEDSIPAPVEEVEK